jgi:hypothetical protein
MAAPEDRVRDVLGAAPLTDAELRALLLDCLTLWAVRGRVSVETDGAVTIAVPEGLFTLARADEAMRPVRWFWQTPERRAAGRPPRAAPSIVAALSALRNAMGADGGAMPRIGAG